MTMRETASLLALAALIVSGCDDAPASTSTNTAKAVVRDLGTGLKPARGPVRVLPEGSLPVEFEPAEMNFGVLTPGDAVRGTSRIWNVGDQPLRIIKSITSCGCTAAEDLAGRVIPPGGFTEFSTTMNMKSGLGEKKEKITVYFEGQPQRVAIQYYTAEVSLPVRIVPPYVAASQKAHGGGWNEIRSGRFRVTALDGKPFRIIRSHGRPPDFVGFDPAADEPRSEYVLAWDMARFEGRTIPWYWVIETDRPDCPAIDARIRHSSTLVPPRNQRPWVTVESRLLVGLIRTGEPFEVVTRVEYSGQFTPDPATAAVAAGSPNLTARLLDAQRDDQYIQYRIAITPATGVPPGLFYGQIDVYASGHGPVPVVIIGRLVE